MLLACLKRLSDRVDRDLEATEELIGIRIGGEPPPRKEGMLQQHKRASEDFRRYREGQCTYLFVINNGRVASADMQAASHLSCRIMMNRLRIRTLDESVSPPNSSRNRKG